MLPFASAALTLTHPCSRTANVSAPFLLAMVRSFGTDPVGVGTSAGYIVSAFFLTQVRFVALVLRLTPHG